MKKILIALLLCVSYSIQAAYLPPVYSEDFEGVVSQTLNDTVQFTNNGFNSIMVYIDVPTSGAVTFQMSHDGSIWESISLRSINYDTIGSVFTQDGHYFGSIAGTTFIRFLTSTGGSVDGSVDGRLSREVAMLEGIEFGNPPHRFGYTPIHVDAQYATAQTGTVLFTADNGKYSVVTDFYVIVTGATDCTVKIFDETDSAGNYLFYANADVSAISVFVFDHTFLTPYISSAAGNSWKLTTDANCEIFINGHGYQY